MQLAQEHRVGCEGFTLVEITIVIVLLSILAMITVPRILSAQDDAKESALGTDLKTLRRQIELYRIQHTGRAPHLNELGQTDTVNFKARMTGRTDTVGKIDPSGDCGPYLTEWPQNPFADEAVAADVTFGKTATPPRDGTSGWYYCRLNCMIYANTSQGGEQFDPG